MKYLYALFILTIFSSPVIAKEKKLDTKELRQKIVTLTDARLSLEKAEKKLKKKIQSIKDLDEQRPFLYELRVVYKKKRKIQIQLKQTLGLVRGIPPRESLKTLRKQLEANTYLLHWIHKKINEKDIASDVFIFLYKSYKDVEETIDELKVKIYLKIHLK